MEAGRRSGADLSTTRRPVSLPIPRPRSILTFLVEHPSGKGSTDPDSDPRDVCRKRITKDPVLVSVVLLAHVFGT